MIARRRVEQSHIGHSFGELRADTGASSMEYWRRSTNELDEWDRRTNRTTTDRKRCLGHLFTEIVKSDTSTKLSKRTRAGKNIRFETAEAEWDKWKKSNAVYEVSGPELDELLAQAHKPPPLEWIKVDKNEHMRRSRGPHVDLLFESRLVHHGDLEDWMGVRTDSPTWHMEGLNVLLSWASCKRLTFEAGDITRAYFQGKLLDTFSITETPSGREGGISDWSAGTMFVARVPTGGTDDAGRGCWQEMRQFCTFAH